MNPAKVYKSKDGIWMRTCCICKFDLPLETCFWKDSCDTFGYQCRCKFCLSEAQRGRNGWFGKVRTGISRLIATAKKIVSCEAPAAVASQKRGRSSPIGTDKRE